MKRLLLIGAGHAHAQVLQSWIGAPVAASELVIVSPSALAPYSGMVPGWLAGTYRFDEICIDFAALARAAGARLLLDELAALDPARRQLRLAGGAVLDYDLLSLNVGSTLHPPADAGARVLSLRPLGRLRAAFESLLEEPPRPADAPPRRVVAVGGGAAGVEALLAVLARLRARQPQGRFEGALVTRGSGLLPGIAPGAVRAAQQALARAGVRVHSGTGWSPAVAAELGVGADDLLLWATGAEAHGWQRGSGLAVSARGFIRVDRQLRSTSHPQVYAVGDCAEWAEPLPKAGVYAVRMGPVLTRNLRAALGEGAATAYVPQHRFLALLATADGRAVASWGPLSARGRWVWRWKDRIDRGFLDRFRHEPTEPPQARLPEGAARRVPIERAGADATPPEADTAANPGLDRP
jgi:pyridine nucleotide-disulfide oxidoreductase family protein